MQSSQVNDSMTNYLLEQKSPEAKELRFFYQFFSFVLKTRSFLTYLYGIECFIFFVELKKEAARLGISSGASFANSVSPTLQHSHWCFGLLDKARIQRENVKIESDLFTQFLGAVGLWCWRAGLICSRHFCIISLTRIEATIKNRWVI